MTAALKVRRQEPASPLSAAAASFQDVMSKEELFTAVRIDLYSSRDTASYTIAVVALPKSLPLLLPCQGSLPT